jgi:Ca-activated chloride channel family protein
MKMLLAFSALWIATAAVADTGVLLPRDKQAPDPSILSLEELTVTVTIDNGDVHIHIVQIFANHTRRVEEGTYQFALPPEATVSDFAVWDGPVRIPAVILERRRAQEIYDKAVAHAIDPGLMQMDEPSDGAPARSNLFSAKIAPIPALGTKRLELDYHQRLATTDFKQFFSLPLKPDAGGKQVVRHVKFAFELHSATPIENLQFPSKLYPLKMPVQDVHTATGVFEGNDVALDDDFSAAWSLNPAAADQLEVITHRDPAPPQPDATEIAPRRPTAPEPGFFEAQVLLAEPKPAATNAAPRTVIVLFDNSLSMQWEKLERSYAALEAVLHKLTPADRFNVILFNQTVAPFQPQPVPAVDQSIHQALDFVRASKLRGGTDLGKALATGLAETTNDNTSLVLLTDGGADRGETVVPAKIAQQYATAWSKAAHRPHTDVFAVGDDANLSLLRILARNDGFMESILSTEPSEFKLQSFLSKLTRTPVAGLKLDAPAAKLVYALDEAVYPGSFAQWVGQYGAGDKAMNASASGVRDGLPFESHQSVPLPATELDHPQLPRLWAQARVNALLDQIDRNGETTVAIDEIIRLSRRYKFVTPYTSFLAAPRSLLRPRIIRPGDPVLRVRTDTAITSVIALFPFGLTKPLRHLASEDLHAPGDEANRLWETRFFAPADMHDGTYSVRLLLRDDKGHAYEEAKTFVIASTPPTVKLHLNSTRLHRGETLEIRASASASTRTLTARLDGVAPIALRWNRTAEADTGTLAIPAGMPIGRYALTVTAEDIAHNIATQEVEVDVIP